MNDLTPRTVRRILGMTQQQFATRLGVSIAAVHDWEQKARPPSPRLQARIDALIANTAAKGEHFANTDRT